MSSNSIQLCVCVYVYKMYSVDTKTKGGKQSDVVDWLKLSVAKDRAREKNQVPVLNESRTTWRHNIPTHYNTRSLYFRYGAGSANSGVEHLTVRRR